MLSLLGSIDENPKFAKAISAVEKQYCSSDVQVIYTKTKSQTMPMIPLVRQISNIRSAKKKGHRTVTSSLIDTLTIYMYPNSTAQQNSTQF